MWPNLATYYLWPGMAIDSSVNRSRLNVDLQNDSINFLNDEEYIKHPVDHPCRYIEACHCLTPRPNEDFL